MAVVGCAVRRVSAPGIALANAQCADGPAGVLSGRALPPGAGLGNAQMDQLVAGTAAAGGGRSQMADGEGREGRWWPVGGLARTKPAFQSFSWLLLEALGGPKELSWRSKAVSATQLGGPKPSAEPVLEASRSLRCQFGDALPSLTAPLGGTKQLRNNPLMIRATRSKSIDR